jgi:ubiquitin C-terminal hydrolase
MEQIVNVDTVRATRNTNGLANMGATCYVNTIVQCLGYCSSFFKFILAGPRPTDKSTPLADDLRDVYNEIWVNDQTIAPRQFLKGLHDALGSYITIFEQNDISEFLMLYLDKLNADLGVGITLSDEHLAQIKEEASAHPNPKYGELVYQMDMNWLNAIKNEYSPIMDLFYGQLISQIVCGSCKHIHHNYETYCNVSVPVPKSGQSLQEAIHQHFSDETMNSKDDAMQWKCDKCEQCVPSKKSIKLWRNPNVMIVSVKRFDHTLVKNNKSVCAPLYLDVSKYTINPKTPSNYKLVAIGNHCGSGLGYGHYNCCCRHMNGKWYQVDDCKVWEANEREVDVALNQGYMYFYEADETVEP